VQHASPTYSENTVKVHVMAIYRAFDVLASTEALLAS
jgi:DNA-binding NarL/FixJ family response regulator